MIAIDARRDASMPIDVKHTLYFVTMLLTRRRLIEAISFGRSPSRIEASILTLLRYSERNAGIEARLTILLGPPGRL